MLTNAVDVGTKRAACLLLLATQFACLNIAGDCGNEITHEARSPDRRWVATSYIQNCGATTGYFTHVVLRDASQPFRGFRGVGARDQGLVYVEERTPELDLSWQGPKQLAIHVTGEGGRVFAREPSWHGVSITYPR